MIKHFIFRFKNKPCFGQTSSQENLGFYSGQDLTPSPSYVIDLKQLDEKVNNVKDFQFLEGYCEPTILLLYEPLRTWAGRIAVRRVSLGSGLKIPFKISITKIKISK